MVNTEINLIIFFAAKHGEALYSQQKQDQELTVAQTIKHLPAMWETQVRFLGREDPLEKKMAPHPSILARRIPWTEEGYSPKGCKELNMTK